MSVKDFFARRLIRLQPMILAGSLVGIAMLGLQHSAIFPKLEAASVWQVWGAFFLGVVMIPMMPSADMRGWNETYPLNAPQWSLFYEYLANIAYAICIRRSSNRALAIFTGLAGLSLLGWLVLGPRGDVIGGWTLDAQGVQIGMTRVAFPFCAGVLLRRLATPIALPKAFAVCSVLLVTALSVPRLGMGSWRWVNGLYEAFCIMGLFPLIVVIGASSASEERMTARVARFFGDLSYPLYITHYPIIYVYTAWVADRKPSPAAGALVAIAVFLAAILLAYVCLKAFDIPVRRWLARRLSI